ncbi:hypothetical protein [Polaribacter atrinae]|uniref:hypothetical protein n=1 Tax=Polaribacter atrinae TaxID=1333662 RepID=UPI0030FBE41F
MLNLSNYEIKISSNTIPDLAKFALDNMLDKLKPWFYNIMYNGKMSFYPDDVLAKRPHKILTKTIGEWSVIF